ncbi:MAG: MiaB/RimO family radical SAM methylthiotransferase [Patescibacteria group bacterium]
MLVLYNIFRYDTKYKMKKYHIITYGCQMNESDSERLAVKLENKKYKLAEKIESADLIVINICSVRQSAIDRVYSKIKQLKILKIKNLKFKIILTGCILEKDKKQFKELVDEIWPIINFEAKTKYKSPRCAFVPIMTGCNNFCSYCAVPYTRGKEKSRSINEIIKEVKKLIKNGYKEITLLGQNVNSYEFGFPQLLKLISQIPGNFQIKFMTSHPKDMSDQLIKTIAENKKISKEIHLPVQSGDNTILKKMNRGYTIEHYKKLIKKIRKAIPKAIISTDIIVGFPGETKKQFENTFKLVKKINFKQIYKARYSPRFKTAASKLIDNIPANEKKRRKRVILDLIKY